MEELARVRIDEDISFRRDDEVAGKVPDGIRRDQRAR